MATAFIELPICIVVIFFSNIIESHLGLSAEKVVGLISPRVL